MKRFKSWEEEHIEFTEAAKDLRLGTKWTLGFLQVIRGTANESRIKDNSFLGFLVPDDHVSLKLIFDNLRNYAICAGFAALALWVWNHSLTLPSLSWAIKLKEWFAVFVWLLSFVLAVANAAQSWVIYWALMISIRSASRAKTFIVRGESVPQRVAAMVFVLGMNLTMWVEWVLTAMVGLGIVLASFSFLAFSVASR